MFFLFCSGDIELLKSCFNNKTDAFQIMWNAPTDYYKQIEFYTITWFGTDTPQYTAIIHSLEKNEQFKNREVSNADFVFDVEMFGKKIFAYSLNFSD